MDSYARTDSRATLLLVDDEPTNLHVLRHALQSDYRLLFAKNGPTALELASNDLPDLILLDVMMPGVTGYEVCETLKKNPLTEAIPLIFVTALADATDEQKGLQLGAVDYITKPFNPHIVQTRIRTHLSLVQAKVLEETRLKIVQCLGKAAEYKDNETGNHVIRVSRISRVLALAAGYNELEANEIMHAAPMHDIGKIGIPDAIPSKPGKLSPEEWAVMRQHTTIGARIIGDHPSGLLHMAAVVALNHHEKWDGSGYPNGLEGEDIPHAARIVALADVFDALTSVRPYKAAWPIEQTLEFVRNESGNHFDPELVRLFLKRVPEIVEIRNRWMDSPDDFNKYQM